MATLLPFLPAILWGVILSVALAPLHAWFRRHLPAMARVRDELALKAVRLATLDEEKAKHDPGKAVVFW
ncbi:MAG: hypothetical protein MUF63_05120 [Rhodobacteraceae bacterium]|jgi:predicted PurR-regulated permease PerM|nr:hypothetical protein [Paracoccaceae bacterium]